MCRLLPYSVLGNCRVRARCVCYRYGNSAGNPLRVLAASLACPCCSVFHMHAIVESPAPALLGLVYNFRVACCFLTGVNFWCICSGVVGVLDWSRTIVHPAILCVVQNEQRGCGRMSHCGSSQGVSPCYCPHSLALSLQPASPLPLVLHRSQTARSTISSGGSPQRSLPPGHTHGHMSPLMPGGPSSVSASASVSSHSRTASTDTTGAHMLCFVAPYECCIVMLSVYVVAATNPRHRRWLRRWLPRHFVQCVHSDGTGLGQDGRLEWIRLGECVCARADDVTSGSEQ